VTRTAPAAAEHRRALGLFDRVGRVAEDDPGLAERDPTATPPAGLDDRPPGE
jgi:hypothetical protein